MERKILETGIPVADCYSKLGAVFSILQPHPEARPWLYYNFTHLIYFYEELTRHLWVDLCNEVFPVYAHEWEVCPFLENNTYLYCDGIRSKIVNVILSSLEDDQFIYLTVNRKFIKNLNETEDFIHDMLIIGYDQTEKSVLCRDFFHAKYSEFWVPFEEVQIAFMNNSVPGQNDSLGKVYALKYQKPDMFPTAKTIYITKELAVKNIKKIMERNFDSGKDLLSTNGTECCFDLRVYETLVDHLRREVLNLKDIRPFYTVENHIKILDEQARYWEIGDTKKREKMRKSVEAMCCQCLKSCIRLNHGDDDKVGKGKVISLLKKVMQLEIEFISSI